MLYVCGMFNAHDSYNLTTKLLLVSERDTIRCIQIRAGAVYVYIYMCIYMYGSTCAIIVEYVMHT